MSNHSANDEPEISDEVLLGLLHQSVRRYDPVPDVAHRAAEDALRWRTQSADIALLFGSELTAELGELVGVRVEEVERFEWQSQTVQVVGTWQPDGSLVGSVSPFVDGTSITVEIQSGAASLDVAPGGRFVLSGQRRAVVRILVTHDTGSTSTEWFVIYP